MFCVSESAELGLAQTTRHRGQRQTVQFLTRCVDRQKEIIIDCFTADWKQRLVFHLEVHPNPAIPSKAPHRSSGGSITW